MVGFRLPLPQARRPKARAEAGSREWRVLNIGKVLRGMDAKHYFLDRYEPWRLR